ncbi:MAG TPA: DnaJ domain-containing protein [Kineosporiaceae bacterium]
MPGADPWSPGGRLRHALRALDGDDAYELLGVPAGAGDAQLRQAYQQRMREQHPDAGGDELRARQVNLAWHLLRTDRAGYDRYRAARARGEDPLDDDGPLDGAGPDAGADPDDQDPWAGAAPWTADARPGADDDELRQAWEDFEAELRRRRERPVPPPGARAGAPKVGSLPGLAAGGLAVLIVAAAVVGVVSGRSAPAASRGAAATYPAGLTYPAGPIYPAGPTYPAGLIDSAAASLLAGILPAHRLTPALHSCEVRADATAWCEGQNESGQLGNGTTITSFTPVPVSGGHRWRSVTVGSAHSCGLRTDRTLWCWGDSSLGQLGLGPPAAAVTRPRQVGGWPWEEVQAGEDRTCGIRGDHTVWCWGTAGNGVVKGVDRYDRPTRWLPGKQWVSVELTISGMRATAADGTTSSTMVWAPRSPVL